MNPDVSVVCSTYQRAQKLPALFAALERQTLARDRFEVVIVDNGSTDETATVLEKLVADSPLRVRAITLPKNRGASAGRNAAWRAALAPVLAFTDDDCIQTPRWLEAGMAAFSQDVAIVVGRTEPNPDQQENSGPFSRTQRVTEVSGSLFLNTCNIFYRREDLDAVGGFDESFGTKGGEDTDLGWRVLDRGSPVVFAPEALVYHDINKGTFRTAIREAWTWRDIPRVRRLHPKRAWGGLVHGVFWKKSHEWMYLALASMLAAVLLRNVLPLAGLLPWAYYRFRRRPLVRTMPGRVTYLPHAFVIDAVEVVTMARGSVKHRSLVL